MQRALSVAVIVVMCWLAFGAHDASWARQDAAQAPADQRDIADKVRLITPGTEITVYLKSRKVLEGTLREVQDDAIVVDRKKGGGSTRVLLADIERLQTKGKGHSTVTYVLITTAVVLGVLIVAAASTCGATPVARQRS